MPRYRMKDGTDINTRDAERSWKEKMLWDGRDEIGQVGDLSY